MNCHNILKNYQDSIVYYQGTFDPAHKGHLSALQTAMQATQADFAVIVVDDADNPHKPNRSSWKARRETALRTFGHLENICVSDLPKEETKKHLKDKTVIALIGSDVWHLYSQRNKINFHGLCINTRNNEEKSYPEILSGRKIISITSPIQECSSTKIRNYLHSHPEFYEKGPASNNPILDQLSPSTLEFILKTKLYHLSKESNLEKISEQIEKYVSENIFKNQEFEFICVTSSSSSDVKLGGQSGDLTFLASSKEGKIFIKVYIRPSHEKNCQSERKGMELLNNLSLTWAKALAPIYHQEENPTYSLLVMPYLEKIDLAKIFKNIQNPESEKTFIKMCFFAGRALSELHHNRSHPIQLSEIQKETSVLSERTLSRLKTLPPEKQEHFHRIFSDSYDDFIKNPGVHTYVHGDSNLSNFVVDEKSGTVYFLDLERLSAKQSENGSPLGFPAEDYYRFLNGINWLNEEGSIPSSVVIAAQEAFKKGYQIFPSSITPEADRYFSNYWRIRNYKFQQEDPI